MKECLLSCMCEASLEVINLFMLPLLASILELELPSLRDFEWLAIIL